MLTAFEQVSGPKKSSHRAISICLYSSPKFDETKHVKPLLDFIRTRDQSRADLLVFSQTSLCHVAAYPGVRVFDCGEASGFFSNVWRYLGSSLGYDSTWFRGADTPVIPNRELKLENMAVGSKLHSVIFPSECKPFRHCTGRLWLSAEGCKSLWQWIEEDHEVGTHWHADEDFLCQWHHAREPRTLLVIDRPALDLPLQEYIRDRLICGPHLLVVKDRDDRQPTK